MLWYALATCESPQQTKNYFFGASLMGLGGVLAGGCTIGAGLSGISTLGIAAFVALASITIGGLLAKYLSSSQRRSTLDALGAH